MKKYILIMIFLMICGNAQAQEVNEKYSYKDFMNQDFSKIDPKEFNDSIIVGSNFFQYKNVERDIFPDGLKNVQFKECNLDNVFIKDGMIIDEKSTNKMIKFENDNQEWILKKELDLWVADKPKYPEIFIENNWSTDPKDISIIKEVSIEN